MPDFCLHVREHLLDYFAQVTSLKHFRHPTIERFSNLINFNDVPILAFDLCLKLNPSGHLHLRQIQIVEFLVIRLATLPLVSLKVSTSILLFPLIRNSNEPTESSLQFVWIEGIFWRWGRRSHRLWRFGAFWLKL